MFLKSQQVLPEQDRANVKPIPFPNSQFLGLYFIKSTNVQPGWPYLTVETVTNYR
jgi:hypothetical protein